MRTLFLLSPLLFWFCLPASSQDADSLNFVRGKWTRQKLGRGIVLVTRHFKERSLFNASQHISYLELRNDGRTGRTVKVGAEPAQLKTVSTFGREANAVAAVNGTFFDVRNGGSVDFVKTDGKVVNITRLDASGVRAPHQRAAVAVGERGLSIKQWDGTGDWENSITAPEVMVSGPLLNLDRRDELLDSGAFNKDRHPRTAVGIGPKEKLIFLTVDGRNANSAGMSLFELRRIMRWLGCTTSVNLDGGGSTTLWTSGRRAEGVQNYPSDNKRWDHEGERKVANVLLIGKKRK
ncbi:phosphodiester glycosidase family protein [Pedobacter sp. JY14-1]|uniref:phosphodiester glycosidase family protein n=1 Tax=Pedobacter sp. JY14-1 TaxID=3034151 RepID=UPI0023E169B0|nr:phosphodiester glycosidase family protein [Pedobacter sp. JY14-1]